MKYLTFIILLSHCVLLSAENSIDEQIHTIMQEPAGERVELMNQFKRQLSLMNTQERNEAIGRLQQTLNGSNTNVPPRSIGTFRQMQQSGETFQRQRQPGQFFPNRPDRR